MDKGSQEKDSPSQGRQREQWRDLRCMEHLAPTGGAGWSVSGKRRGLGLTARNPAFPSGVAFFHLSMGLALNGGGTESSPVAWVGEVYYRKGRPVACV